MCEIQNTKTHEPTLLIVLVRYIVPLKYLSNYLTLAYVRLVNCFAKIVMTTSVSVCN